MFSASLNKNISFQYEVINTILFVCKLLVHIAFIIFIGKSNVLLSSFFSSSFSSFFSSSNLIIDCKALSLS